MFVVNSCVNNSCTQFTQSTQHSASGDGNKHRSNILTFKISSFIVKGELHPQYTT